MKKLFWMVFALACAMPSYGQQTKERLTEHVYTLASDSLEGRRSGTRAAFVAAGYVASQFAGAGLETWGDAGYLHPFETGGRERYNVIGVLPGCDPLLKDEWIILGAHFDHMGRRSRDSAIYHGADDNASGTAVLIETARELARRRGELRRSVMLVAFDAEELGLVGSKHLAENLPEGEVKLMASLDMVGWLHKDKKLRIAGVAMLDGGKEMLRSDEGRGPKLKLKNFDTFIFGGSDHEPFALKGIPALYISTGFKSPYHEPEDTADKIDYDGLALITGYMTDVTAGIASRDRIQASGKLSFKHRKEPLLAAGVSVAVGDNGHLYKRGALDGKRAFAWNAGLYAQFNFGKYLAVRPRVVYEQRRAKMPFDAGGQTLTQMLQNSEILHTSGLYVPLEVMFKARFDGTQNIYIYLFGGGYYSRLFTATRGGTKVDFSAAEAMRRDEWGLQCGAGINVYKFWLEGVGRFGLTDVYPKGADSRIRNASAYFSVGYRF